VAWDDARGRISFHTLVSAGMTPSSGLVAGLANAWHQIDNRFDAPMRFFYVFPGERFEDVEYVFA